MTNKGLQLKAYVNALKASPSNFIQISKCQKIPCLLLVLTPSIYKETDRLNIQINLRKVYGLLLNKVLNFSLPYDPTNISTWIF